MDKFIILNKRLSYPNNTNDLYFRVVAEQRLTPPKYNFYIEIQNGIDALDNIIWYRPNNFERKIVEQYLIDKYLYLLADDYKKE